MIPGRAVLRGLIPLAVACGLRAQSGPVLTEIQVTVTAAAGKDVYVDHGRVAGIEPGDEITLFPAGGGSVIARVQSVSRSNARAEILGPARAVPPGTRGTARVPKARQDSAPTASKPDRVVPAHPPWQQPLGKDDADKPLLAPVASRTPAERPMRVRGRTWINLTNSWNREPVDQQFLLGSVGTDLRLSNPLGGGGELHVRGDFSHRRADLDGAATESVSRARLDRFSYRYGHADDASRRVQVGRFLQSMFPELGLVDGVEADTKLTPEQRVGFSFGGFPEPFTAQSTGDDLQAAFFWRYADREDNEFDVGLAYQKTWHEGTADRDLLLLNTSYRPGNDLRLYSSIWVDYYTGSEQFQSSGLEVTEVLFNGSYRLRPSDGLGLSVSHIRWPDLRRSEFRTSTAQQVLNARVTRVTGNSWHDLTQSMRLSLLGTYWEDDRTDGMSGELGVSCRDVLAENSTLSVNLFHNESSFQDGQGARLTFSQYHPTWSYNLGYELASYDNSFPAAASSSTSMLHAFNAGAQASLTSSTSLSMNLDYRFGDDQDAVTLGVYFQTRY